MKNPGISGGRKDGNNDAKICIGTMKNP